MLKGAVGVRGGSFGVPQWRRTGGGVSGGDNKEITVRI